MRFFFGRGDVFAKDGVGLYQASAGGQHIGHGAMQQHQALAQSSQGVLQVLQRVGHKTPAVHAHAAKAPGGRLVLHGFVHIDQQQGLLVRFGMIDGLLECALVVQAQVVAKPEKGGGHGLEVKAQLLAGWGVV